MTEYRLQKHAKQIEAIKLIVCYKYILLEGGGRSGKTLIILYALIVRCWKQKSDHLVCRFRFAHVKVAICHQTMPKLLEILGIQHIVTLNKSDWYYEFPNGSRIWIAGLDDKERTEKILGNEYASIFMNEASQISYDAYEMIITRLNPPRGMKGKVLIDYNPPSKKHWGYLIFHERRFPDGRPVPENDYVYIKINPGDNPHNSPEYLGNLEQLSYQKKERFLLGNYTDDMGKLWNRSWIRYEKNIPDLYRVVIGVDPSGSVKGDEIGIVGGGIRDGIKYILDDYSLHGTPAEWAAEVVACYWKWKADVVVAEKNYGGDMVESTIKNADPRVNVKLITSSRGKIVRAEPVSAEYEKGRVYHRTMFQELEDEMCFYDPEVSASPNRMDALVFTVNELDGGGVSILDVI